MPRALFLLLLLAIGGCGLTIREEARRAEARLPTAAAAALLERAWSRLDEGKRIFDIRVSDRARVLSGEGAVVYRTRPLRLRLDVFGPHSTLVLSMVQRGDSMSVSLPEERRYVSGPVGGPELASLTEGRAFTGHELLGALLGAYDPGALLAGPADTVAYARGEDRVVSLLEESRAHRFTYAAADSTLREYRQQRGGRDVYRVRFSDYRDVEGRRRPFRVELQDVAERRTVRVDVRRESFGAGPTEESLQL